MLRQTAAWRAARFRGFSGCLQVDESWYIFLGLAMKLFWNALLNQMILVSNWGQQLYRQPESASPRHCINSDNLNGIVRNGQGFAGNATDEQWAAQVGLRLRKL